MLLRYDHKFLHSGLDGTTRRVVKVTAPTPTCLQPFRFRCFNPVSPAAINATSASPAAVPLTSNHCNPIQQLPTYPGLIRSQPERSKVLRSTALPVRAQCNRRSGSWGLQERLRYVMPGLLANVAARTVLSCKQTTRLQEGCQLTLATYDSAYPTGL